MLTLIIATTKIPKISKAVKVLPRNFRSRDVLFWKSENRVSSNASVFAPRAGYLSPQIQPSWRKPNKFWKKKFSWCIAIIYLFRFGSDMRLTNLPCMVQKVTRYTRQNTPVIIEKGSDTQKDKCLDYQRWRQGWRQYGSDLKIIQASSLDVPLKKVSGMSPRRRTMKNVLLSDVFARLTVIVSENNMKQL